MLPDDVVRLPAGWYPDPTGLPQLRWWDNQAWTQHTTAARQPLIAQESRLAWADDLPTRRERREREREDRSADDLTPATAQTLLQLAPPSGADQPANEPAPELREDELAVSELDFVAADDSALEDAAIDAVDLGEQPGTTAVHGDLDLDTDADTETDADASASVGAAYEPVSAVGHAGRVLPLDVGEDAATPLHDLVVPPAPAPLPPTAVAASSSAYEQLAVDTPTSATPPAAPPAQSEQVRDRESAPRQMQSTEGNSARPGMQHASVSTAPGWVIALLPLLQLVIVLLLVTGFGAIDGVQLVVPVIFGILYLTVIVLAIADRHQLRRNGVEHPAHWAWSFLTSPVYLFVRAVALTRSTGHGFGPMLVWFALIVLNIVSVVAVPGMLITAVPTVFAAQAEQSVTADAAANGAELAVTCPAQLPVLIGATFECGASSDSGKSFDITVSLQRSNGWIDWRVDDWGVNTLSR